MTHNHCNHPEHIAALAYKAATDSALRKVCDEETKLFQSLSKAARSGILEPGSLHHATNAAKKALEVATRNHSKAHQSFIANDSLYILPLNEIDALAKVVDDCGCILHALQAAEAAFA